MGPHEIVFDDSLSDVKVVSLRGEHDISTADELRSQLDRGLAGSAGIVVDLTNTSFVDSSILGALLDVRQQALERNQGFAAYVGDSVEPSVQRILDVTGLITILPVISDRDEAIQTARRSVLRDV